jgi:NAD(P)-dependent dehydrogenase (short-subunit alcohol dehydrogenase family)
MSELTGKVALVTGGSRGIGAAIARRLAGDGAAVALTYVSSKDKAEAVAKEIEADGGRALVLRADNADPAAVALKELLVHDAVLELPPSATWFEGGAAISCAVSGLGSPGDWRMTPIAANGQPAAAAYLRGEDGIYRAYAIVVLTTAASTLTRIVVFGNPALFPAFGMPAVLLRKD